jgi:uncharacterized protein YkwD
VNLRNIVTWILAYLLAMALAMLDAFGGSPANQGQQTFRHLFSPATSGDSLYLAYIGCGGIIVPSIQEDYEQRVVELVNQARAEQGLPPLKRASSLVEAARFHAADMIQDAYFEHDSYNRAGSGLVYVCPWQERVIGYYSPGWLALSENIAAGQPDPESVVMDWMNSMGHRRNILSLYIWEIGVGYASGGAYSHYWVQDFGRREGIYPIVINNEAAVTETRTVELYIYGDWQEMRFRNDDGDWGAWQPFRKRLPWTINGGNGDHRVWVELRSPGRNAFSSDSITLSEISALSSLVDLPDEIQFHYSIPEGKLYPSSHTLNIQTTDSSDIREWTASLEGQWFQVSSTSGVTPQAISIWPIDCSYLSGGLYNGTLTISASGSAEEQGSSQTIQLRLHVSESPVRQLFLPLSSQSY